MKYRPLKDGGVIRPAEGVLKYKGGIIVRRIVRESRNDGEMIAVESGLGGESGRPRSSEGQETVRVKDAGDVPVRQRQKGMFPGRWRCLAAGVTGMKYGE
jgi:chaperonin GroES